MSVITNTEPAARIRAVAADEGITLREEVIREFAEQAGADERGGVWMLVGALTETIATLVEAQTNGDASLARIALQVGAERVVGWEQARTRTCDA